MKNTDIVGFIFWLALTVWIIVSFLLELDTYRNNIRNLAIGALNWLLFILIGIQVFGFPFR